MREQWFYNALWSHTVQVVSCLSSCLFLFSVPVFLVMSLSWQRPVSVLSLFAFLCLSCLNSPDLISLVLPLFTYFLPLVFFAFMFCFLVYFNLLSWLYSIGLPLCYIAPSFWHLDLGLIPGIDVHINLTFHGVVHICLPLISYLSSPYLSSLPNYWESHSKFSFYQSWFTSLSLCIIRHPGHVLCLCCLSMLSCPCSCIYHLLFQPLVCLGLVSLSSFLLSPVFCPVYFFPYGFTYP